MSCDNMKSQFYDWVKLSEEYEKDYKKRGLGIDGLPHSGICEGDEESEI